MKLRCKNKTKTHQMLEEIQSRQSETLYKPGDTITLNLDDFEVVDNLELFNEYFHNLENYEVKHKPNTPKCTCLQNPLLVCKKHDDKPPKIEKLSRLNVNGVFHNTDVLVDTINQLVDAIEEINNDMD